MGEKLCRVTITDVEGGGHVVEVWASSLFEAVAQAVKLKGGSVATDGFRPIKVLVFEPKAEYEVKLKDFMAWLDRNSPIRDALRHNPPRAGLDGGLAQG